MAIKDDGVQRSFDTGATRDTSEGKLDYDGFLSPQVLRQYARYMNMNRLQSDGKLRASDNWQKGIPMDVYRKSAWRHFFDYWENARVYNDDEFAQDSIELMAACSGLLFNIMGYMHEWLKKHPEVLFDTDEPTEEMRERQAKIEEDKRRSTDPNEELMESYESVYSAMNTIVEEILGEQEGFNAHGGKSECGCDQCSPSDDTDFEADICDCESCRANDMIYGLTGNPYDRPEDEMPPGSCPECKFRNLGISEFPCGACGPDHSEFVSI
jgi:hypothetical protein